MTSISGSGTPSTQVRTVMACVPQSASTAITSTGIDCLAFSKMKVSLLLGAMTATATLDLTVEESDVLGSGYAAVTGAVMAQRLAATHASKVWTADLDLTKRKRYIRIVATCATAASLFAVQCDLFGGNRTETIQAAQLGSSPAASPLSSTDVLFSV